MKTLRKILIIICDTLAAVWEFLKNAGSFLSRRLRIFLTKALDERVRIKRGRRRLVKLSYCAHLILFPLVFIYFEIILRIINGTGVFQNLIYPVLFAISLGMLFNLLNTVFKKRTNHVITVVILFFTGFIYAVECLVYNSYQTYMTFSALLKGAGGVMTGFGGEFIQAVISGILPIILFAIPGVLYLIFGKRFLPVRRYKKYFLIAPLIVSLFFFGLGTLAAATGASAIIYGDQFEFDTGTAVFGLPTSLRLSIFRGENTDSDFEIGEADEIITDGEEEIIETDDGALDAGTDETLPAGPVSAAPAVDYPLNRMDLDLDAVIAGSSDSNVVNITRYVQSLTPSSQNAYTGLFEGKNLIMICAEAFSDAVISPKLTPTLYRMVHNGFYFPNYYQPAWGGSTSSGEYSMLIGLVPTNGINTMQDVRNNNLYFTMGNQLQRLGYYNAAFHNGTYNYYDRQLTHYNLGYGTWLGQGNGLENVAGKYPDDATMLCATLDRYVDQAPFSVYYMTVCGHAPYKTGKAYVKSNRDYVLANIDREYQVTTLCYLAYQVELEKAMTALIEKLEEYGIADDTVICLTSDHYPYGLAKSGTWGNDQDYIADLYNDPDYSANPWTRDHNTLIIWSGCLENEHKDMACEITDVACSLDIVPTLSNLFGLEFDSRLLVGRDVFSGAEPFVVYANGTFITNTGGYNSKTGEFVTRDGSAADENYVKSMKSIATNKIKFSKLVKSTDYYAVLFGKDTDTDSNIRPGTSVF